MYAYRPTVEQARQIRIASEGVRGIRRENGELNPCRTSGSGLSRERVVIARGTRISAHHDPKTAGDLDGDGSDEIVTAPGPSSLFGSHIRGWNADGGTVTPLNGASFFAWPVEAALYGARVAARVGLDADGRDELVVGGGPDPDTGCLVRVYDYEGSAVSLDLSLDAYPELGAGTSVAPGRFQESSSILPPGEPSSPRGRTTR